MKPHPWYGPNAVAAFQRRPEAMRFTAVESERDDTPAVRAPTAMDRAADRIVDRVATLLSPATVPTPAPAPALPAPKPRERMAMQLRAAELHRELALVSESLAGDAVNPPPRQAKPRKLRVVQPPRIQPSDLDVARAKKIMKQRGMIR